MECVLVSEDYFELATFCYDLSLKFIVGILILIVVSMYSLNSKTKNKRYAIMLESDIIYYYNLFPN